MHGTILSLAKQWAPPVDVPDIRRIFDILVVLETGRDRLALAKEVLSVEELRLLSRHEHPEEGG